MRDNYFIRRVVGMGSGTFSDNFEPQFSSSTIGAITQRKIDTTKEQKSHGYRTSTVIGSFCAKGKHTSCFKVNCICNCHPKIK
jgi:hypothetical protein